MRLAEQRAREAKASKIADVLAEKCDAFPTPALESLRQIDQVTRELVSDTAHVGSPSDATWQRAVDKLIERRKQPVAS